MFRRYHRNGRDLGGPSRHGGKPCRAWNRFHPVKCTDADLGNSLEHLERISEDDILRTVAFFRYINPEANIRLGAGRALLTNDGETAFKSGASATITGNMLTTVACATIRSDKKMLEDLGRNVTPEYMK